LPYFEKFWLPNDLAGIAEKMLGKFQENKNRTNPEFKMFLATDETAIESHPLVCNSSQFKLK
jgi:hypothetical protein